MKISIPLTRDNHNSHVVADLEFEFGNLTTTFKISDSDRCVSVSNKDLITLLTLLKTRIES